MTELKRLGFFHELTPEQAEVALSRLRQDRPLREEDEILRYLQGGKVFAQCMQVEEDSLTSPPTPLGPVLLLTDGKWAWAQSLCYFVCTYHLRLPAEFLDDARANGWICPVPETDGLAIEGHQEM